MGDPPRVSDYITPAPPFMAGTNVLNKAITDIWAKRQEDEKVRILAAQQAATQAYQQGELGNVQSGQVETHRHNVADEGYNLGRLDLDRHKQFEELNEKILAANNAGNPEVAAGLAADTGYFGLAPQVMAAPVAGDPSAATAGPAPGIAGGQPMTPPVTPQDATAIGAAKGQPPATAQPELNTPQPPAPAQTAPTAPSTSGPVPTPGSPVPAAPAQPGPSMPPPDQQTRREDIHNQPKPPGQLGIPSPVDPRTPPRLPEMPYANDPSKNPIALGAEPGRDADVPTGPGAVRTPGPAMASAPGGAPGGLDEATQRRWAARGVMPNAQAIQAGKEQRVRDALRAAGVYAHDSDELRDIDAAIEQGVMFSHSMPADKAITAAMAIIKDRLASSRAQKRTNTMAAGTAARGQDSLELREAAPFISMVNTQLKNKGVFKDVINYQTMVTDRDALSDYTNPVAWETLKTIFMRIQGNVGVSTEGDIKRAGGESSMSLLQKLDKWMVTGVEGGTSKENFDFMMSVLNNLERGTRVRMLKEYKVVRRLLESAPNETAFRLGRAAIESGYGPLPWGEAAFEDDNSKGMPALHGLSSRRQQGAPPPANPPPPMPTTPYPDPDDPDVMIYPPGTEPADTEPPDNE